MGTWGSAPLGFGIDQGIDGRRPDTALVGAGEEVVLNRHNLLTVSRLKQSRLAPSRRLNPSLNTSRRTRA